MFPVFEIIEKNISFNDINKKEIETIEKYKTLGYNLTNISPGGFSMSKETREKISKANKGKFVSQETRKKQSISRTGQIQSKEHAEKSRKSSLGKKRTTETKEKLSKAKIKYNFLTYEFLYEQYIVLNKTVKKITEETGCKTVNAVVKKLKKFNLSKQKKL